MAKNGNIHPTRIFKSPDELFDAWNKYKESLKEQAKSWPKVQYVGKDGVKQTDYPKLPFTLEGFSVFCHDNYGTVKHYMENTLGYYDDFCTIVSRIREEIRNDQITGGMLGDYSSSITARLNGLTEKTDTTNRTEVKILNIDPLAD